MGARPWLAAAAVLAGVGVAGAGRWSRGEGQNPVSSPMACRASADRSPGCLGFAVARELSSTADPVLARDPGQVSTARRALAEAPEPVRALIARFRLEDLVAEYEHLSGQELALRMDRLRAQRQSLEAETERLNGQHFEALTAGNRVRVAELRQAMSRAVQERSRLAAALLIAGCARGGTCRRE